MNSKYVCICGKKKVKLWRPDSYTKPLICSKCAEKYQSISEHEKWKVNKEGKIPSYHDSKSDNKQIEMTDHLVINVGHLSTEYPAGDITMIPAVPCKFFAFWVYDSIPKDLYEEWKNLPTK